jgi:hypothetical protein
VALWFWFKDQNWQYKGNLNRCLKVWLLLRGRFPETLAAYSHTLSATFCDDELDAIVAWLLVHLWLQQKGVLLIGTTAPELCSFPLCRVCSKNSMNMRRRSCIAPSGKPDRGWVLG